MNIETKRFKVASAAGGIPGATVTDKRGGRSCYVAAGVLPSVNALALMSESAFDAMAAGLMANNGESI